MCYCEAGCVTVRLCVLLLGWACYCEAGRVTVRLCVLL